MNPRREELKALSAPLAVLKKSGAIDSINDALADIYAQQGHTELKSYKQWKESGKQVRKGEKALLLWGKPTERKKKEGEAQNQTAEGAEDNFSFFPVAYVFSNLQVEAHASN